MRLVISSTFRASRAVTSVARPGLARVSVCENRHLGVQPGWNRPAARRGGRRRFGCALSPILRHRPTLVAPNLTSPRRHSLFT